MASNPLKRGRVYLRLDSAGKPVNNTNVTLLKKPANTAGRWIDITECASYNCCVLSLTGEDAEFGLDEVGPVTEDLIVLMSVVSSNGDTITVTEYEQTVNGVEITIDDAGEIVMEIADPLTELETEIALIVHFTDEHGNDLYKTFTITVDYTTTTTTTTSTTTTL